MFLKSLMVIIKRRSSLKNEIVPEQQIPKAILAITPEEHHDAVALHNIQEPEHQGISLYHKSLAEAYKIEGLRKLCKRHKAIAKYHKALAKAHHKTALAHEKLAETLVVAE
jgi:hypothetical protein